MVRKITLIGLSLANECTGKKQRMPFVCLSLQLFSLTISYFIHKKADNTGDICNFADMIKKATNKQINKQCKLSTVHNEVVQMNNLPV